MIYFDKIEVVNMLDAKKAHNTIKYAPGIMGRTS
jgi:hypothetical protein